MNIMGRYLFKNFFINIIDTMWENKLPVFPLLAHHNQYRYGALSPRASKQFCSWALLNLI